MISKEYKEMLGLRLKNANDIWFDLKLGDLTTNESGAFEEYPLLQNRGHLCTFKLGDISKHKEKLCKSFEEQLDKLISNYTKLLSELNH